MDQPTRAQVFGALAAAEALPVGADYVAYNAQADRAKYDRALDVLATIGWLPDPADETKVERYGDDPRAHEEVNVPIAGGGSFILSSPIGHTPLTSAAREALPIERLDVPLSESVSPRVRVAPGGGVAIVTVRVGDAIVEIEGPSAELIAEAVRSTLPDVAGRPLASRDDSSDAQIVQFPVGGRERHNAPHGRGA